MRITVLRKENYKSAVWSGGTTTELYLYPENGSYADRNFQFRISSATVELEESDFTALPGVTRYITPLDGSFVLSHPNCAPVALSALAQPYQFSGETPTHCVGKATDFNLMLKNCQGKMELWQKSAPIRPGFNSFYPTESTTLTLENQTFSLEKGDMLVVFAEKESKIFSEKANILTCWAEP